MNLRHSMFLLFLAACCGCSTTPTPESAIRQSSDPDKLPLQNNSYSAIYEGKEGIDCGIVANNTFWAEVSQATIVATPSWNLSDGNPPLSAVDAMALADATRKQLIAEKLLKEESEEWPYSIAAAELTPWIPEDGKWFWVVRFIVDGQSGPPNELFLYVMMNGRVLKPQVIDWTKVD